MATRTQIARSVALGLSTDRSAAIMRAAAWLTAKGKTRQASYLVRDVAWILEQQGYVYAKVTTAKPLSNHSEKAIIDYIKSTKTVHEVELEVIVDPSVIGGVRIETPSSTLDETVLNRLQALVREVEQ
jgi:F-type H+-transporting ATPase subunit delta